MRKEAREGFIFKRYYLIHTVYYSKLYAARCTTYLRKLFNVSETLSEDIYDIKKGKRGNSMHTH